MARTKSKKYFVFADPHGNLTALKEALKEAGYNPRNKRHHLIGLGDYFDRGTENAEMAEFIVEMHEKKKATFIKGNHDQMLIDVLEYRDDGLFNCTYNGLNRTINDLSGDQWFMLRVDQGYIVSRIKENHPKLLDVLKQMKDIIEIKDFVLTHAGYSNIYKDPYRTDGWEVNPWARSDSFVEHFTTADQFVLTKTYVFGHWHAFDLRKKFQEGDGEITPEPFIHRNFVGLDACTIRTNKVNIYIIDEGLI